MLISKKTIIFEGFRGVPIFSRGGGGGGGVQLVPGGGGGGGGGRVQMLISIETDKTCDFPKRVGTPYPHLWIRA